MDAASDQNYRFNRFVREYKQLTGHPPNGSLLDFGCGAGAFLISAFDAGLNAFGIEVAEQRLKSFKVKIKDHTRRSVLIDRFRLYDGLTLPFPSSYFDTIYSWFVFEHVHNPALSLRELVRVSKPGAYIFIYAEDARNSWDGHAKIPWPLFMPRTFAFAWLDVFELGHRADFIVNDVVYVTAPIVAEILRTLGCDILYQNADPQRETFGLSAASEFEVREIAKEIKARFDAGQMPPPTENLHVVARKR